MNRFDEGWLFCIKYDLFSEIGKKTANANCRSDYEDYLYHLELLQKGITFPIKYPNSKASVEEAAM